MLLGVLVILGDFMLFFRGLFLFFWGVCVFLFLGGLIFGGFFAFGCFWFVNSELVLLILLKFS